MAFQNGVCRGKWVLAALAVGLVWPAGLGAQKGRSDDVARLKSSAKVMHEVMKNPDQGIPQEILAGAQCIAIVPGMKKGALVVGADYGKGVATCREGAGGAWQPPLFITIGGGSLGLQVGGESRDVVMLFGDRSQLDHLLTSKARVGAEAAAAAGPVGRHADASTDVELKSKILTYGRSKGGFAGLSISGAVVQPDASGNDAMYGQPANPQDILSGKGVTMPPEAQPLIKELNSYGTAAPGGD